MFDDTLTDSPETKSSPRSAVIEFGRRLRAARLATGISQERLSLAANLNVNQVGWLEAGKHDPRLGTARAIATALGVPLTSLIPD